VTRNQTVVYHKLLAGGLETRLLHWSCERISMESFRFFDRITNQRSKSGRSDCGWNSLKVEVKRGLDPRQEIKEVNSTLWSNICAIAFTFVNIQIVWQMNL